MNKRIAILVGGRPQIIKAFPLLRELSNINNVDFFLINSGQHYSPELSQRFFKELKIKKAYYNLKLPANSPIDQIAHIVRWMEKILTSEKPDCLILFGDMNTTLAGAIAASKSKIPIVHVEAGIRSGNIRMPEERNRIITDHLSRVLAAPNKEVKQNLREEGIGNKKQKIIFSGDIMLEAMNLILKNIKNIKPSNSALLTIHRAENTQEIKHLKNLLKFVESKSIGYDKIIFPIHPRTKKILKDFSFSEKFKIIKPVAYKKLIKLCLQSKIIFTDSGGLQKEACWLAKPCVILRDETEWPELIKTKRAVLYKNYHKKFKFNLEVEKSLINTPKKILEEALKI
jgi:UDP-GlcNAc3NAcA epimerase